MHDLALAQATCATRGRKGICVRPYQWTIVVLRDGRRSRPWRADVAQLVAHHLAKVRVAGSNPVIRSRVQSHQPPRWSGRVVRQRPAKPCTRVRFPSPPPTVCLARLAQRESASLTRKRSLVQSQYRAPMLMQVRGSSQFDLRVHAQYVPNWIPYYSGPTVMLARIPPSVGRKPSSTSPQRSQDQDVERSSRSSPPAKRCDDETWGPTGGLSPSEWLALSLW
jgi:hypothetical protein